MHLTRSAALGATFFALTFLLMAIAGGHNALEEGIVTRFVALRANSPALTDALALVSWFGNGIFLIPLALVCGALLAWRRQWSRAALIVATPLVGRLVLDSIKYLVARERPAFDLHPVYTYSMSFPSGHAGNTMMTYLALALFLVPADWRRRALGLAIGASLLVGATRPMLGVHWPSDVIGGWAFGLVWMGAAAWLAARRGWIEPSPVRTAA